MNGLVARQLANALWDAVALAWWTLVAGCVAFGGCWYMGQFVYADWARDHPPPRLRFLAERRLGREFAQGLADLEDYLLELDPTRVHDAPAPPGRSWTWRQQGWRRP